MRNTTTIRVSTLRQFAVSGRNSLSDLSLLLKSATTTGIEQAVMAMPSQRGTKPGPVAIRKMHFLIRAKALVAFPGGFGTLDELFETLTLLQSGKAQNVAVVLVGRAFWDRLINWQWLVEQGLISQDDLALFHYAETAQETWNLIARHNGVPSS